MNKGDIVRVSANISNPYLGDSFYGFPDCWVVNCEVISQPEGKPTRNWRVVLRYSMNPLVGILLGKTKRFAGVRTPGHASSGWNDDSEPPAFEPTGTVQVWIVSPIGKSIQYCLPIAVLEKDIEVIYEMPKVSG